MKVLFVRQLDHRVTLKSDFRQRPADGRKTRAFSIARNIQSFGDVSEFGLNGDSAPNRRWNYRYEVAQ